jgi:uncharacterized repeat protein (TIGR01451 family)
MNVRTLSQLVRPLALALVIGGVLLFGLGGTTWATPNMLHDGGGTTPKREADVAISKRGNWQGDTITFNVHVTNNGPTVAQNVVVSDHVSGQLRIMSVTTTKGNCALRGKNIVCSWTKGNCELRGQNIVCSLDSLAVNEAVDITIVTTLKNGNARTVRNTATVTSETRDPDRSNNESTVIIELR